MLEPLHPELDFVPDTFLIFLIQELASKLPPSNHGKCGPVFLFQQKHWSAVVGLVFWEVGCLRAEPSRHVAYYATVRSQKILKHSQKKSPEHELKISGLDSKFTMKISENNSI